MGLAHPSPSECPRRNEEVERPDLLAALQASIDRHREQLRAALDSDQPASVVLLESDSKEVASSTESTVEVRQGRRFERDGERHCTCRPACCYCRSPHDEDEA